MNYDGCNKILPVVSPSFCSLPRLHQIFPSPVENEMTQIIHVIFNSLLNFCILMDLPIHTDTLSMGLPLVYFKGSQVEVSKI